MKDNLLEVLLNLFEKSLSQLNKAHKSIGNTTVNGSEAEDARDNEELALYVRPPHQKSIRVLTLDEQMKLTKTSYQFLIRMQLWKMIDADLFEIIMNQLQASESPVVTLQETKWTLRNVLMTHLNAQQLAFLDLILYQSEDELTVH
jgi:uncharacterized protein Smg (DUF494 family)